VDTGQGIQQEVLNKKLQLRIHERQRKENIKYNVSPLFHPRPSTLPPFKEERGVAVFATEFRSEKYRNLYCGVRPKLRTIPYSM
jgi:hypothetical protein